MDTHPVMNEKQCYCGPVGVSVKHLLGKPSPAWHWPGGDGRRVYYTHRGRCGLGLLCDYWKLRPEDEILAPAYNCGSEIDPFLKHGLKVVFYRVDGEARIDCSDIQRRVTDRTKVIYVTHYFGWPQKIEALSDYCKTNKIYLIEDCALSLYSDSVNHPIGVVGNAAIYSFPKTLPVPDGGALTVSCGIEQSTQAPPRKAILRKMLPLIKRTTLRLCERTGLYRFLPQWLIRSRGGSKNAVSTMTAGLPGMPESYYYDRGIEKLAASRITRRILRRTCAEAVVRLRRDNYRALHEVVKKSKMFRALYDDLPDGVCPLYLPVVVENREAASVRLNEMGITAVQWWAGFHREFDWAGFAEAKYLKEHLLAIPVHHQLSRRHIEFISSALEKQTDLAGKAF